MKYMTTDSLFLYNDCLEKLQLNLFIHAICDIHV
jgi:hypothetical protein